MNLVAKCANHQVLFTLVDSPDVTYQQDLGGFLEFCEEQEATVYAHSLLRNFGELTPYLFSLGFDCIASNESFGKRKRAFKKIETKEGSVLRIEVKLDHRIVKFYDSKKLLNSPEDDLRNSFNVDGDDLQVVAKCIGYLLERGLDKTTIGANAWFHFIENKFGSLHKAKRVFVELNEEAEDLARRGYRGGWCYLNPEFQGKEVGGFSFDVNSMYPWVMWDHMLPVYEPVRFEGEPDWNDKRYPLFIVEVVINYAILKEGCLPWLVSDYELEKVLENEYITERYRPVRLVLTNMELQLLFETYEFSEIEYKFGYKFKATQSLFKEYVNKWYEEKLNSTGARREVAKLMLNNLYGKFATCKTYRAQTYYINPVDGVEYKRDLGEVEGTNLTYYTPMATFITAYARCRLIRTANANHKNGTFIYSDTDSIKLAIDSIEDAIDVEVNQSALGFWKCERQFTNNSKFLGLKCYTEQDAITGKYIFKVAGLPCDAQEKLTIEQFYIGSEIDFEVSVKIPGGVGLTTSKFTLGKSAIGKINYLDHLKNQFNY